MVLIKKEMAIYDNTGNQSCAHQNVLELFTNKQNYKFTS